MQITVAVALMAFVSSTRADCTTKNLVNVDFVGNDLNSLKGWGSVVSSSEDCAELCLASSPQCGAFTYAWKKCFLKSAGKKKKTVANAISGLCTPDVAPVKPVQVKDVETVNDSTSKKVELPAAGGASVYTYTQIGNKGCCRLSNGKGPPQTSYVTETAKTIEECQTMCNARGTCTAIEFAGDMCELHTAQVTKVSRNAQCKCMKRMGLVTPKTTPSPTPSLVTQSPVTPTPTNMPPTPTPTNTSPTPSVESLSLTNPDVAEAEPDTEIEEPEAEDASTRSSEISLQSTAPTAQPTELAPSCTFESGTVVNGYDLPNGAIKASSAEECVPLCLARDGCTQFSHLWGKCWLKFSRGMEGQMRHTNPKSKAMTGDCSSKPAAVAEGCTLHYGRDFYGNNVGKVKGSDPVACAAKCTSHPECTHFTTVWGGCFLKSSQGTVKVSKTAVSGHCPDKATLAPTNHPRSPTLKLTAASTVAPTLASTVTLAKAAHVSNGCVFFDKTDLKGNDLPKGRSASNSPEACSKTCLARMGCSHFTHFNGLCFLKKSDAGRSTFSKGVSGACTRIAEKGTPAVKPTDDTSTEPVIALKNVQGKADDEPFGLQATSKVINEFVESKSVKLSVKDLGKGPHLPNNIYEAQGGVVNGKLYVFGGFVDGFKRMGKETWEYNPSSNRWSLKAQMPGSMMGTTHCANAVDPSRGTIFILGGLALREGTWPRGAYATKDVLAYNAVKNTWSRLPDLPEARGGGAAVVLDDKLHFFNGASFDGQNGGFQKDFATHWALDLKNPSGGWKNRASNSLGRNHLGGVVWGGKIYAIGGQFFEDEGCSNQKLVEAYNPAKNKWTRVANLPIGTGHISPATHATKHGFIVVGGVVDKANGCHPPGVKRSQLLFYNPTTDKWTDLYNKHGGASAVSGIVGNTVYVQHGNSLSKIGLDWDLSGAAQMVGGESASVEGQKLENDGDDGSDNRTVYISVLVGMIVMIGGVAAFVGFRKMRRMEKAIATNFSAVGSEQPLVPSVLITGTRACMV